MNSTDSYSDDNLNWKSGATPGYVGDSVLFAGSTPAAILAPVFDQAYTLNSITFSNNAGAFVVSSSGNGAVTVVGGITNSYTGNTIIASGSSLILGSNSQWEGGVYAGNMTNSGTSVYGSLLSQTNSGVISGAGGIIVNAGNLTLSGANTFTGNILVNGAILCDTNAENASPVTVSGLGNAFAVNTADGKALSYGQYVLIQSAAGSITSSGGFPYVTGTAIGTGSMGAITVSADGSQVLLTVSAYVPSQTQPTMTFGVNASGNLLTFSWPADHLGYALQTNSVNIAVATDWHTLPGSATVTNVSVPISKTGDVYYRLYLPQQ